VLVEAVRLLDGPCCWPISCSTSVPGAQRNRLALHRIHSNHQTAQPYENCHGQRGRTWSQSPREYPLAWSQFGGPGTASDLFIGPLSCSDGGAPRGIRTPHRQIRSLVLCVHEVLLSAVCAAQVRCQIQPVTYCAIPYWLVD
jgi:hypothetical protein